MRESLWVLAQDRANAYGAPRPSVGLYPAVYHLKYPIPHMIQNSSYFLRKNKLDDEQGEP